MRKSLAILLVGILSIAPLKAYDRQWTVFLVHHTHTDIGYTRPQAEILAEHLRYIDYAVEYCEMTSDYPEDSKFRWTCESAWVVARYLESRPEDAVRRFLRCIRDGRIEVTALDFNMAETVDENVLRRSLEDLKVLSSYGIKPVTAMQNDVNGIAWSYADWLPELGVRYLWMGEHPHKAYVPFDKPSVFHWCSPSGESLLAYRSDHYMTGNYWGIEQCDSSRFAAGLESYLNSLSDRHYQFDAVAVPYSGAYTDNAPPSVRICDFIRKWNETHDNPKLRSSLSYEFPQYIEEKYPELLRTFRCAWPDWWTDGFASAARETALDRGTQSVLTRVGGLLAQSAVRGLTLPEGVEEKVSDINGDLMFYNEHTFGASESISDPYCINSQKQWMGKASFVWSADRNLSLLNSSALAVLKDGLSSGTSPVLAVFNGMAWERSGYVDAFIDFETVPENVPFRVVGDDGSELPMQTMSRRNEGRMIRFYVSGIPSLGYRTFMIDTSGGRFPEPVDSGETALQYTNGNYSIVIDSERGCISSITDLGRGCELVDGDAEWGLGQYIYETLGDRWTLAWMNAGGLERMPWKDIRTGSIVKGMIFDTIEITGTSPSSPERPVQCLIRMYHDSPVIELVYAIRRSRNIDADAVYVAFPFAGGPSSMYFDVQGGEVNPGVNQLEGTSSAWNTVQNYVAVRNQGVRGQTLLNMPDTPIAQLGNMLGGRFQYFKTYDHPHVYSWVMNNYWTTNFKAEQEGEFSWRYQISTSGDSSPAFALTSSLSARTMMDALVLPAAPSSGNGSALTSSPLIELSPSSVVPMDVYPSPDGKYIFIYLRETSGTDCKASVRISGRQKPAYMVSPVGTDARKVGRELELKGFSNKLIWVKL